MSETLAIRIQGLRFAWQPLGPDVLSIDELSIPVGEQVFIRGPSGSGKSTLLSLLGGVLTPRQGRVEVLQQDIGTWSGARRDRFRADHIGFIFQLFNLIPYLSVVENVTLPTRFSHRRLANTRAQGGPEAEARRLLAHLGLDDGFLQRPVTDLSVGQQQRVAAARALLGGPELIIADEPTSSLDADRRQVFLDLLFRECQRQGATLVFVSHDPGLMGAFSRTLDLAELNQV